MSPYSSTIQHSGEREQHTVAITACSQQCMGVRYTILTCFMHDLSNNLHPRGSRKAVLTP